MARRRREEASRQILSLWERPQGAGDPIACVATTFTFDPVFFEEHCLSRFLGLETDPREDGAQYLIEREEKLFVTKVCVLVDRTHADGSASARWDVLPVTVPGRIMHAKISVLAWSGLIRLLVGSANLTEPAYRKNQEVVGVLDFRESGEIASEVLQRILAFLEQLAALGPGSEAEAGPKARLLALVRGVAEVTRRWKAASEKRRDWPQVAPILLGPLDGLQEPIPARLGQLVRDRGGPATQASVVSPFFDHSKAQVYPATEALLEALTDRGQRELEFLVPAEPLPDGRLRVRAPRSLARHGRKSADITVYPVSEEVDSELRPLHTKSLWLWNDRWHVYTIGSSNFTTAGLGLAGSAPNVEANLAYIFPEDASLVAAMEETLPDWGDPIKDLDSVLWEPADEAEGENPGENPVLPQSFEEALFEPAEPGGTLRLRFGRGMPATWELRRMHGEQPVYSADDWSRADRPRAVELPWQDRSVPTALRVLWLDESGRSLTAAWPVGVTDPGKLPPPEDLRNLSLETLVEILCSRLPLHEALSLIKARIARSHGRARDELPPDIDPHRRVNTETFLLQRTRRVARALAQLVENLNRPAIHPDALAWRLRGPVGPLALARALHREARSPGEASFLLSEIALALSRLDAARIAVGVSEADVRRELQGVRSEVEQMIRASLTADVPPTITDYLSRVLDQTRQ